MFASDNEDAALAPPSAMDMFGEVDVTHSIDDMRNVNAMDMFGSDEEVSGNDGGTSFPPGVSDMFSSEEEDDAHIPANVHNATQPPVIPVPANSVIPTLVALTIQDTPAEDLMQPAALDMFGESPSEGGSDAGHVDDMFSTDGDGNGSPAVNSDVDTDNPAADMFSEYDPSDVDTSAAPYGRFTAADFDDLDDGLFDAPVDEDSD